MRILSIILALGCAAPALAQETTEDSKGDAEAGAGEILVTAQRRSERLTDVPISISVLTGEDLAASGVRGTDDLSAVVPSLNYTTNGAFAQPTVRGIGTTVSSPGSDASVAIYMDGVYQPNQIGNFSNLADLEQVKVLKGPQGTLFGRNATDGAIRITTKRPSFTPAGNMSLSYGRFDEIRDSAYRRLWSRTDRGSVAGLPHASSRRPWSCLGADVPRGLASRPRPLPCRPAPDARAVAAARAPLGGVVLPGGG